MFNCTTCNKVFTVKRSLTRHIKTHEGGKFKCSVCPKSFNRQDNLIKHSKKTHEITYNLKSLVKKQHNPIMSGLTTSIAQFGSSINRKVWTKKDIDMMMEEDDLHSRKRSNGDFVYSNKLKKTRMNMVNTAGFVKVASSHNHKIVWYYAKNITNITNYLSFFKSIKSEIIEKLSENVNKHPIKFNLKLESTYNIPHNANSSENRAFKTSARAMFIDTDIKKIVEEKFSSLLTEEDIYTSKGSGFTLEKIDGLLLAIYHYTPMGGSSYIELPTFIANKKAVINPQNKDDQCFKWAILARHVSGINRCRVSENYTEHEEKYNFAGISFPTPLNEIKNFEKYNPGVSVNIYGLEKKEEKKNEKSPTYEVYPLKVVDDEKPDHFDILLINENTNSHYTYIANFPRLVGNQKTLHGHKIFICKKCFTSFDEQPKKFKLSGQAALDEHKKICSEHKAIRAIMPKVGDMLEFETWGKTQRHPIVIYADFEALLGKCRESKGINTQAFQRHDPMSYGIYVKISDNVPLELLEKYDIPRTPIIYRGCESRQEVAKYFVQTVLEIAQQADKLLKTIIPIIMTNEERRQHFTNTNCNLCKSVYSVKNYKVKDHDHLSGRFRQTLCNNCNMKLKAPKFVPCFLHNLSNYDAHFIVHELGFDENTITVIPNSEEKYISFSKYINKTFSIRFIDTYRFMTSSLATLASNILTTDFSKFRETAKFFKTEDMPLVTRKGVFPYEYADNWFRLEEKELPTKEHFYSTLSESHISDEDYEHATVVWKYFDCQTLGEYSDLYLKIDIMLLADVFENFRDICQKTYNLDPAHYYTAPGFSFDCMLKYTEIKLELLTDYDMLLMFEKGIRGGLTQASMRYAKANNHTTPDFDDSKPNSWIIYQDCNNLYGWAMSQNMPYGGFKWAEPTLNGLNTLSNESSIGRMYEVDISYPQHLHDEHNDLPFLPNNSIPIGSKVQKLMATLGPKTNYIIHYRNLQQAIANGLIVEKVHKVLEFYQSPWLAKYINLNTEMRKKAENDFEKDFFKLMNNAVFGKTMENERKRLEIKLVSSDDAIQKLINRPTFKHVTRYDEHLSAVSLDKKIIKFQKPIYIGFSVLEVSKTLMYDYHYSVMKKHYNNNIKLMYTDTDSLIYYVQTTDFYKDLLTNPILLNRMDTSNLPKDHPCYIAKRKKIPGLFSDETDGDTMLEFVALRAKSYAYSVEGVEKVKAKGIRRHVVKKMTLEDHKRCIFGDNTLQRYTDNISIRSYKHQPMTIISKKLTYNSHDDKRYVLDDNIHTLAHGHYNI